MISSLRGTVLRARGGLAVIEAGGVGFSVQLTPDHVLSLRTGDEAFVHTRFIVREDSFQLFGFASEEQAAVFDLLTSVTGVGPKSALGVLAVLTPEQIADAVESDDEGPFRAVSGIGVKTAKLIVVSLAGKLDAFPRQSASGERPRSRPSSVDESVIIALVGLGWPERVAREGVAHVIETVPEAERTTVQDLLRRSLSHLGPTPQGNNR